MVCLNKGGMELNERFRFATEIVCCVYLLLIMADTLTHEPDSHGYTSRPLTKKVKDRGTTHPIFVGSINSKHSSSRPTRGTRLSSKPPTPEGIHTHTSTRLDPLMLFGHSPTINLDDAARLNLGGRQGDQEIRLWGRGQSAFPREVEV